MIKKLSLYLFVSFFALTVFVLPTFAGGMKSHMESFRKYPKATMQMQPEKYNYFGQRVFAVHPLFSKYDVVTKNFVNVKLQAKRGCSPSSVDSFQINNYLSDNLYERGSRPSYLAEMDRNNSPRSFLETASIIDNIKQMDVNNLRSARLSQMPWSGDYWAVANGILGARNFDNDFIIQQDWLKRNEYVTQNNFLTIFNGGNQDLINVLSPSEKYELIVGDTAGNLTKTMWAEGKQYYDEYGEVETWMGICHGWAAAAYLLPKPQKAVTIPAYDGKTPVKFYPSEIKGLATHLWAKANYPIRFMSQRCSEKEPKTDENGRVIDAKCFDSNPGAWHIAIVNQLGIARKSFILDATYDYEVWNQPVYEYAYTYYNMATNEEAPTLEQAIIPIEQYTEDGFKKYRSPKAKFIVGISMNVSYMIEVGAYPSEEAVKDSLNYVNYYYDLELDENFKIIGGEWYTNLHPDFIWNPSLTAQAKSPYDAYVTTKYWDGINSIPEDWKQAAQYSNQTGMILNTIVQALIIKSRQVQ